MSTETYEPQTISFPAPQIETVEYNGRKMSFLGGGSEHITGGEGPIIARHFDVKPGEVVFDVGAAGSNWSLYALASGAKMVYAFEPCVPYHKKMVEDVLCNPGFYERSKILLMGLDKTDRWKTIEESYIESGGADGMEVSPEMTVPARFVPMDFFMPEVDRLDWVKMDIEGFEWNAIVGGRDILAKHLPNFIIENHQYVSPRIGRWMRKDRIIEHIYAYLLGLGYKVTEDTHPNCHGRSFIIAKRK